MEMVYQNIANYNEDFVVMNAYNNYLYEKRRNINEGIERGVEQKRIDVAKAMLSAGETKDKVQLYTGLSFKEIEKNTCKN